MKTLPNPRLTIPPIAAVAALATIGAVRRRRRMRAMAGQSADVAFMVAMHDALRRDLDQLTTDMEGGDTRRDMWHEFREHLMRHNDAEDEDLWPTVRDRLADPAERRHIDAIVEEHRALRNEVELIDAAFASPEGDSGGLINLLARTVRDHLEHEERSVLPLLERNLSQAEWHKFLMTERRRTPLRRRPELLGWTLDEANDDDTSDALAEVARPTRTVYRRLLRPRYAATHRRRVPA